MYTPQKKEWTIISKEGCPFCKKAKTLLEDQVILDDYDEKWPKLALVEMESIKKRIYFIKIIS